MRFYYLFFLPILILFPYLNIFSRNPFKNSFSFFLLPAKNESISRRAIFESGLVNQNRRVATTISRTRDKCSLFWEDKSVLTRILENAFLSLDFRRSKSGFPVILVKWKCQSTIRKDECSISSYVPISRTSFDSKSKFSKISSKPIIVDLRNNTRCGLRERWI